MSTTIATSRPQGDQLSVRTLSDLLRTLPLPTSEAQRTSNLGLISCLGASIGGLLKTCLEDSEILAQVAAKSYRHTNHFDKIVLVDSDDGAGYRLTMHLWQPPYSEDQLREELIHDHRFSFWSTVIAGQLVSKNYARTPNPAGSSQGIALRQYRYRPQKQLGVTTTNFYEFAGDAVLHAVGESTKRSGEAYYLNFSRIHRVALPTDSLTCTLVLRGPREREFSSVYNSSYPTMDMRITNERFTSGQLVDRLNRVLMSITTRRSAVGT